MMITYKKPVQFFKKKIIRLYVPWLLYGIIFVLLHNLFLRLNLISYNFHSKTFFEPYNFSDIIEKILLVTTFFKWKEPLLAPMWFLFGLFSGLTVLFIVSYVAKKTGKERFELYRFIFISIIVVIGFIGVNYEFRFAVVIYRTFIIAGLMYIGKLYHIYEHKINIKGVVALVCFIALIIATILKYDINIAGMRYGNPFLFILLSCAGFYMVLYVADYIVKYENRLIDLLYLIGENSLSIMALHYLAFKLISLFQIFIYDYPIKYLAYYPVIPYKTSYWWVAYTIVGIIVPLVVSLFYDRIIEFFKRKFGFAKSNGIINNSAAQKL